MRIYVKSMELVERGERLMVENPYKNSDAVRFLLEKRREGNPLRIAFWDIDSTITHEDSKVTAKLMREASNKGFVVIFVTSRTEEMTMSDEARKKSKDMYRPEPHMQKTADQRQIYVDPSGKEPEGTIDVFGVAGSTGSAIYMRQADGSFQKDSAHEKKMNVNKDSWRKSVLKLVDLINQDEKLCELIPIEYPDRYWSGETDVYPPDFRIQLKFRSAEAENKFRNKLLQIKLNGRMEDFSDDEWMVISNLRYTGDSKPSMENYSGYLAPAKGNKARAAETVFDGIFQEIYKVDVEIKKSDFEVLFAGDSFPDLAMGLFGARGCRGKFVIVGGSRLTRLMIEEKIKTFVNEKIGAIKHRLGLTDKIGIYNFRQPLATGDSSREVIIGDVAYPGKFGPQTILEVLKQFYTS